MWYILYLMKVKDLPKHHAILLVHENRNVIAEELFAELEKVSPAHRFFNQTVLNIENARAIISWAQSPYSEERVGIISFHTIGLEAQNALLKILEEPQANIRFVLVTSNVHDLLGTVLSRVQQITLASEKKSLQLAEKFLSTKHALRMKLPEVVSLLSMVDEEDRKDKEKIKAFILSLAEYLIQTKEKNVSVILDVFNVAKHITKPSASGKTLLEYLALLLPKVS